jgi:Glutaredoxin-like domain (DUF836)
LRLTLYSKPGCHLCDEMKAVIRRVIGTDSNAFVEEIDISADPSLLARYGVEIPVLEIDGRKVAKYRVTEEKLRAMMERRREGSGRFT